MDWIDVVSMREQGLLERQRDRGWFICWTGCLIDGTGGALLIEKQRVPHRAKSASLIKRQGVPLRQNRGCFIGRETEDDSFAEQKALQRHRDRVPHWQRDNLKIFKMVTPTTHAWTQENVLKSGFFTRYFSPPNKSLVEHYPPTPMSQQHLRSWHWGATWTGSHQPYLKPPMTLQKCLFTKFIFHTTTFILIYWRCVHVQIIKILLDWKGFGQGNRALCL